MVVNDHDGINAPYLSVFCDMREITCIGLLHASEGVLLKLLPVTDVRVPCRFQVIVPDKALDGADTDFRGDKSVLKQVVVDLCGIEARESLLHVVDLLNSGIGKDTCYPLIGTEVGHQRIIAAAFIQ